MSQKNSDIILQLQDKTYVLPQPSGVLSLEIVKGKNLVKKDISGASDPYVMVSIGCHQISFKDRFVSRDVNPQWNYQCNFALEEPYGHILNLKVMDFDNNFEDDFMGEVDVEVETLVDEEETEHWVTLEDVKHGEVLLRSQWNQVLSEPVTLSTPRCIVSFYIHSAENITTDIKNLPYTRCEVQLRNAKKNVWVSKTCESNNNPKFKEGSYLISNDIATDSINLTVEDQRSGKECFTGFYLG